MSFFLTQVDDGYGGFTYMPTVAGYTVMAVALVALLLIGTAIASRKSGKFSAKKLSFSAVAIALATVTSMLKIFKMPMGGSVTLFSMLIIVLIGYWFGLGSGLCAAIGYGVLQMLIDPYIISLPQMLIDYILAFGALGLSGAFKNYKGKGKLYLAYIVAVLGRYFFAFLSGWIFFGTYAADYGFSNGAVYSLAYNGAYLGLEALLSIVLISIPPVRNAINKVGEMANV